MTNALVVADDFTGAMDTGYGFASSGRSVRVWLRGSTDGTTSAGPPETDALGSEVAGDVLAVDADTRDVDPDTASAVVSELLASADAPLVYKKIDSTLRGNVVAEVDAAVEAIDAELAVVAPAFPSTGRTTADGRHRVDGVALEDADYGVSTSNLREFFDASRYAVRTFGLETVADGSAAVESALEERVGADPVVVTCDATRDRHLQTIASGAQGLESNVVFVGSGGLASAVSVPGAASERPADAGPTDPRAEGDALAVVGSVNDRTLEQLATVPDDLVHRLEPSEAVCDPERAGLEAAAELASILDEHGRAVVTGATSSGDVERAGSVAAERGVDAGDRVASALAAATAATDVETDLAGLFLTGGSVARAVLDALSASAIDLTGEAAGDGIPAGRIADGRAAGATVVTKAGGFGTEGSIVNCLNFLSGHQ